MITFLVIIPEGDDLMHTRRERSLHRMQTLMPDAEIVMFVEAGVPPFSTNEEFDVISLPAPLRLDAVFDAASQRARHQFCCCMDARVLISSAFVQTLREVLPHSGSTDLLVGKSVAWNGEGEPGTSVLPNRRGSDYFIFHKARFHAGNTAPISMRGSAWKNWLFMDTLRSGRSVVDLSPGCTVFFQGDLEKREDETETDPHLFPVRARNANRYELYRCNKEWRDGAIRIKPLVFPAVQSERLIAGGPDMASSGALETAVAIFLYQRTTELAKVIACVRAVRAKKVYAIADAPHDTSPKGIAQCNVARAELEKIDWPCILRTNFTEQNVGAGKRVKSGIDWVFSHEEQAIFLEDDVIGDPDLFHFCETMLVKFKDDPRVGSVNGTMPLSTGCTADDSYFFSKYFQGWGWASWRRAWEDCDLWMEQWPEIKRKGLPTSWFPEEPDALCHWTGLFDLAYAWHWDTWDFQWELHFWRKGMVHACSTVNLASNIGFGPNAAHCTIDTHLAALEIVPARFPPKGPDIPERNADADAIIQNLRFQADEETRLKVHSDAANERPGPDQEPFLKHPRLLPLLQYPGGMPGKCKLPGVGSFEFDDVDSLLEDYAELFCRRLLRFNCETASPLILDCGAGPGLGVLFFKKRFPYSRIVAFESDPDVFEMLQRNISERACDGVVLHQKAPLSGGGMARVSKPGGMFMAVQTRALDSLLCEPVEFLRLVLPGLEGRVLSDARKGLSNVKRIHVKISPENPSALAEILGLLETAGFQVVIESLEDDLARPFQEFGKNKSAGMNRMHLFGIQKALL